MPLHLCLYGIPHLADIVSCGLNVVATVQAGSSLSQIASKQHIGMPYSNSLSSLMPRLQMRWENRIAGQTWMALAAADEMGSGSEL